MAKAGQIDHSGHPHPSTPKMRALCRANGGTGSVKPIKPDAQRGTSVKPNAQRDELLGKLFGNKSKTTPPAPKKSVVMSKERHAEIMERADDEDNQMAALLLAPAGIDAGDARGFKSDKEEAAVKRYISEGYGFVNSFLRGQFAGNDSTRDQILHLDKVMERSKLTDDAPVFRGVDKRGRVMFGDAFDGDMTGYEWREKGFSSTTTNEDVADDFSLGTGDDDDDEDDEEGGGGGGDNTGSVKMRIVLPKGTRAIQGSEVDEEAELILARDSNFRVIQDRGWDPSGVRILDVELVSQGGKNVT